MSTVTDYAFKSLSIYVLFPAALAVSVPCRGEVALSVFAGQQATDNGDLHYVSRATGTDIRFNDVRWREKSFDEPLFYGARAAYWLEGAPNYGLAIDFTHAKTYAADGDSYRVKGVRNGSAVNGRERFSNTIDSFNMSHGLNMITFNGMYRWFPTGQRDDTLLGRLQVYSGLGAGFSIPHVEAEIKGVKTEEFQAGAGPVVNGMVGLNYDIASFLSGFLEYKLSYANVDADLKNGGTINAESVNHQFIFGLTARFGL